MKEINKLTERLLSEGYTEENQPKDYVPYNKYYGGWQYSHKQQRAMTVKTPCGLLQQAIFTIDMGYLGIDWCLENDNVTVCCPYGKLNCEMNNELLRDKKISLIQVHCAAKITDEQYDYEKSIRKVEEIKHQQSEERIKEFAKTQDGFCRFQLRHNSVTDEYYIFQDLWECAHMGCSYCTLRKQSLGKEKGNVFYDLKITTLQKGKGFLPDEEVTTITKGIRLFEKNINLEKCKWIVENPELIDAKVRNKYYTNLFFAKYHGQMFEYEILNIRAEKRVSRDLDADLQDLSQGIAVVHQSDLLAEEKEKKHENRLKAIENKIKRLKKSVEINGFSNLPTSEQYRIKKLLDKGLITQSEFNQWQKTYETNQIQRQMSLFT